MGKKVTGIWNFIAGHKYIIAFVVGIAVVGFIDDNSFMRRVQYELQISQLKDEIERFRQQNEKSTHALQELKRNPRTIEKIARERYFMKADDEDIYVLSTDQDLVDNNNPQSAISTDETTQ